MSTADESNTLAFANTPPSDSATLVLYPETASSAPLCTHAALNMSASEGLANGSSIAFAIFTAIRSDSIRRFLTTSSADAAADLRRSILPSIIL